MLLDAVDLVSILHRLCLFESNSPSINLVSELERNLLNCRCEDHSLRSYTGFASASISLIFMSTQGFDMVQLVLIFCLAASPTSCREERPVVEQLSLMTCMVQGQQIAQELLADRPKWLLSRWRCEQNVPRERPI
jgi:hypothetical protein